MACMGGARWAHLFCIALITFGSEDPLGMFFEGGKRKRWGLKNAGLEEYRGP